MSKSPYPYIRLLCVLSACFIALIGCSQTEAPEAKTGDKGEVAAAPQRVAKVRGAPELHTEPFSPAPKPASGALPHALSQQGKSRSQIAVIEGQVSALEIDPADPVLREELAKQMASAEAHRKEMLRRAQIERMQEDGF